jgi:hypothetical protein
MRLLLLLFLLLCFSVAGCAPTIANLAEYHAVQLSQADFMPTAEQVKSGKVKVVVFPLTENTDLAKRTNLGAVTAGAVESQLADGAVELVDRNNAAKLRQEVQLAEINDHGTYNGPEVADFAISGSVDKATLGNDRAAVSGKIKIIRLPSLKIVKTITFSDSILGTSGNSSLVVTAATDAIHSARIELKNYFAKKGYVLEKRSKNDETIYKINLGTEDGLKTGDTCQIYTISRTVNAITQEETTEELLLGEGTVSNQIGTNYSWLIIEDADMQSPVRLGDYIKLKHSKEMLEGYSKGILEGLSLGSKLLLSQ